MTALPSALVGYTGFVGSNLASQHHFDALFNSRNIQEIAGLDFDLLVVSAMPAAMWIANQDPVGDRAVLDQLAGYLRRTTANKVVVVSTVAVYPQPKAVDEDSLIDETAQSPYGRHRLLLERQLADYFPKVLTVRLPGLFGPGLKKNAVYDLLHKHELSKVNSAAAYQFYNLERLWADISTAFQAGLNLINVTSEPLSVRDVAREVFELDFANQLDAPPALFDVRSKHAALFGGRNGYLYDRATVLDELRAFVDRERSQQNK